jgi:hypothetical protein
MSNLDIHPREARESEALASWIDGGGGELPDVEAEVLEAVVAIRPDWAPRPRVSLDDILSGVRSGPLAAAPLHPVAEPDDAPRSAEVVALRPLPAARPRPSSVGRWSGLALVAAAAATFALVALPTMRADVEESPTRTAVVEQAAPAAPAAPPAVPDVPAPPAVSAAERPVAAAAPAEPPMRADIDAYDMNGVPLKERELIPELAEGSADGDEPMDWLNGLPSSDRSRVSALLDAAENAARSGDHRQAGDLASRAIAPPTAAAHAAAWAASGYFLAAGDRKAAADAASKGLSFDGDSPDFSRLALRYAELIRGVDPAQADEWSQRATAR